MNPDCIRADASVGLPAEYLLQWLAKDMRDAKRDLKRGGIFALLDCGNRLARDAHLVAQIALSHFSGEEPKRPDVVGEGWVSHASPSGN